MFTIMMCPTFQKFMLLFLAWDIRPLDEFESENSVKC